MGSRNILLIVGGGIAAYKSAELIRLIRKSGGSVTCVLTKSGAQFITEMTLAALSESRVYTSLWDLKDEVEMGHIQLSRQADLVLVCPATADLLAKMASGIADDLATTLLLATDKKVVVAPAMNVRMWEHAATKRNVQQLRQDGVVVIEPDEGAMACGEYGPGRLPEPQAILAVLDSELGAGGRLEGKHIIVTAGPTVEPIDPVRIIANRSSGKQGFAIAEELASLGARVTLISGPVALPTPAAVEQVQVETAVEMQSALNDALPADAAVLAAAVADWRVEPAPAKLKKSAGPPDLSWQSNPDILAELAVSPGRPKLLIGFAAETGEAIARGKEKLSSKGCDWIVANDVSQGVFGSDSNQVHLINSQGVESWEPGSKRLIARRLAERIANALS